MRAIVLRALLIRPVGPPSLRANSPFEGYLEKSREMKNLLAGQRVHIKEMGCSLSRLVDANCRLWSASLSFRTERYYFTHHTFISLGEMKKNVYIISKKSKRSCYFNILRAVEINAGLNRMRELVACFISICFRGHLEPCSRPDCCSQEFNSNFPTSVSIFFTLQNVYFKYSFFLQSNGFIYVYN